jgi:hypothetical protein
MESGQVEFIQMADPLNMNVGLKDDLYVVTNFDKKIREFGLTSEEVDKYIELLRTAQAALLRKK